MARASSELGSISTGSSAITGSAAAACATTTGLCNTTCLVGARRATGARDNTGLLAIMTAAGFRCLHCDPLSRVQQLETQAPSSNSKGCNLSREFCLERWHGVVLCSGLACTSTCFNLTCGRTSPQAASSSGSAPLSNLSQAYKFETCSIPTCCSSTRSIANSCPREMNTAVTETGRPTQRSYNLMRTKTAVHRV